MKFNKVILVDDSDTALFLNKDVVEEFLPDAEVLSFASSQEFIKEAVSNELWDLEKTLVLLDINMPGKSGFEVLDELEEELEDWGDVKFLMVTSSTFKRDIECSDRYQGMLGYIVKPLSVVNLQETLKEDGSSWF